MQARQGNQKPMTLDRADRIHYAVNGFLVAFMAGAVIKFANVYYEIAREFGGGFYVLNVALGLTASVILLGMLLFLFFTLVTFPRRNRSRWIAL